MIIKCLLLVVSLVALVSSAEDWSVYGRSPRFPFLPVFTPNASVEYRLENHALSKALTQKDWISFLFFMGEKLDVILRCSSSSYPEHVHIQEVAEQHFFTCMTANTTTLRDNIGDSTMDLYCKGIQIYVECFVKYTDELQPCLPRYKGKNFPFYDVNGAVFNYMCADEKAKERYESFRENVLPCNDAWTFREGTAACGDYPHWQGKSYVNSEKDCSIMSDFWTCVEPKLPDKCTPAVLDYLRGMENATSEFYDPCPYTKNTVRGNLLFTLLGSEH